MNTLDTLRSIRQAASLKTANIGGSVTPQQLRDLADKIEKLDWFGQQPLITAFVREQILPHHTTWVLYPLDSLIERHERRAKTRRAKART